MLNYYLSTDYGECSADPRDYWYSGDNVRMPGALVKRLHPYITRTGRTVFAWRLLKHNPSIRDLRRLERAVEGRRA